MDIQVTVQIITTSSLFIYFFNILYLHVISNVKIKNPGQFSYFVPTNNKDPSCSAQKSQGRLSAMFITTLYFIARKHTPRQIRCELLVQCSAVLYTILTLLLLRRTHCINSINVYFLSYSTIMVLTTSHQWQTAF